MTYAVLPVHTCTMGFMGQPTKEVGEYPEFGALVRDIVDGRSTRRVQIRTGVSHTTIGDMMKGIRPKQGTIRLFAEGMGVDPNPLLEAAGYPAVSFAPVLTVKDSEPNGGEIERVSDSQEPEDAPLRARMMAAFDQLPMRLKQLEVEQAEALLEEMYRGRKDIIGKRAE